jgi:hypothetical protein
MAKRRAEELGLPFEPDAKATDSEDTQETPEDKDTENTETK